MTTMGPDGRVHRYTNDPDMANEAFGPAGAGGRQIPVPTLNDFLGMHAPGQGGYGPDGGRDDPFNQGGVAQLLRQLMTSMNGPIAGNRGDYLPYVRPLKHTSFLCSCFVCFVGRVLMC